MYIPFGKKEPDEKDKEFLTKLGFDLKNMKHVGRYYLLEVPTQNPDLKCTSSKPDDRKTNYSISFKNIPTISVETGRFYATGEPYASFTIFNRSKIEEVTQNEDLSNRVCHSSKL
ncbi:MAG: hypothetical protein H0T84_04795 [Tatlockia sp.]|nr:hypothetical protein [Tatlockia sp.]